MRKLVVGTFLTLDGVMQAPGGPDEELAVGCRPSRAGPVPGIAGIPCR